MRVRRDYMILPTEPLLGQPLEDRDHLLALVPTVPSPLWDARRADGEEVPQIVGRRPEPVTSVDIPADGRLDSLAVPVGGLQPRDRVVTHSEELRPLHRTFLRAAVYEDGCQAPSGFF